MATLKCIDVCFMQLSQLWEFPGLEFSEQQTIEINRLINNLNYQITKNHPKVANCFALYTDSYTQNLPVS